MEYFHSCLVNCESLDFSVNVHNRLVTLNCYDCMFDEMTRRAQIDEIQAAVAATTAASKHLCVVLHTKCACVCVCMVWIFIVRIQKL